MNATVYHPATGPTLTGLPSAPGSMGRSASGASAGNAVAGAKPLWAAVGVLSVCVLALGASLVHVKSRPLEPGVPGMASAITTGTPGVPTALLSAESKPAEPMVSNEVTTIDKNGVKTTVITERPAGSVAAESAVRAAPKRAVAKAAAPVAVAANTAGAPAGQPVYSGTSAGQPVYSGNPTAVGSNGPSVPVAQAPVVPVCGNCGTVESVTPVVRKGQAGPAGLIGGGVVGAVLGNQVGSGNGRALATVLGAAGGAWAGGAIEKNVRKETVYAVRIRMDDASYRTVEQASAPGVGAKVTLDGNTLRGANGAVYPPVAAQKPRAVQPARDPVYMGG